MLTKLNIQNIALIDRVEVDFGAGLNILTGETGAGKSIVIDAITAIIGGRMSKDLIRTGCEKTIIEGIFILNNDNKINELKGYGIDIDEDNTLLIVREFYINGKNICRINGRLVTVSTLKQIGEYLVDIHGQQDNQSLLKMENHINFLDAFIGEEISKVKNEYLTMLGQLKDLRSQLSSIVGMPQERAQKIDLLEYQIRELSEADLKIGEEDELMQKRLMLINAEKLSNVLTNTYEVLAGNGFKGSSIGSELDCIVRDLKQVTFLAEKYSKAANVLEDIYYNIQEFGIDIRIWRDEIEYNQELLNQLEERLDMISRLKRKYGKDIDSVLAYFEKIKKERADMEDSELKVNQMNSEISLLKNNLIKFSKEMSDKRIKFAKVLETKIEEELSDMEMKNTNFIVDIQSITNCDDDNIPQFNQNGLDRVEFLISPNPGEKPKPLAKIASGGEMSRIMLAIKTILAKVDNKSTLIFDEVDTGISGRTAQAVGEKLVYLASNHQVICVTHLVHIAAMADIHFNIEKIIEEDRTRTQVKLLNDEEEISALARILGGANITDTTISHANEIKENSTRLKLQIRDKH